MMSSYLNYVNFHLIICLLLSFSSAFPDQGKWSFSVDQQKCHYFEAHNALFKNSAVTFRVTCDPGDASQVNTQVSIGWVVRQSPCFQEYLGNEINMPDYINWYYYCPAVLLGDFGYNHVRYLKTQEIVVECNPHSPINLVYPPEQFKVVSIGFNSSGSCSPPKNEYCETSPRSAYSIYFNPDGSAKMPKLDYDQNVKKSIDEQLGMNRDVVKREAKPIEPTIRTNSKGSSTDIHDQHDHLVQIPNDGVYLIIFYMKAVTSGQTFNASVDIEMRSESGYLSAVDWPFLPFYGVMCLVYVVFAIAWLVVTFMQWRDLLRIQFWIGAVILLGMIEKAVFYAEYQSINSTGTSVKGAVMFAEMISCLKRTLARMLVIIVSCGFGIVKPRLGVIMHRVVYAGTLYFVLGNMEAYLRIYKPKNDPTNQTLMAGVPLAVLDSVLCWWIFSSLVDTMRTLRLRRNIVKLNLYQQFTNTLIFAILASIVFMIWTIRQHKLSMCLTEWKQIWFDDAYWHILFSIILLVIMVLWRPSSNNQRYAFTPLLDASDDEFEEKENQLPHEAFDGMKMRQQRNSVNHSSDSHSPNNIANNTRESLISKETEDNLKWIEENIPTTLVDAALPALIDSDEEIITTRLERNKME